MVKVTITLEAKGENVFGATIQHWSSDFKGEGPDLVAATNDAVKKMSRFVSQEDSQNG